MICFDIMQRNSLVKGMNLEDLHESYVGSNVRGAMNLCLK
jgi:hypothetical protein